MTRDLGGFIAHGNTADVYSWSHGTVVKVLHPGIPANWADSEARTSQWVHEAGLPAPKVQTVTQVMGRPAIVFEKIEGRSMWDEMVERPHEIPRLTRLLADLQASFTTIRAPVELGSLHDRLRRQFDEGMLGRDERADMQRALSLLPDGRAVCHFDVHPANVIMSGDSPVVVDWFDMPGTEGSSSVRPTTPSRTSGESST